MPIIINALAFVGGLILVGWVVFSAMQTIILPRNASDTLTRVVFYIIRLLFAIPLKFARGYNARDNFMAFYAPIGLLALIPTWYFLTTIGYSAMYWALGTRPWSAAFILSGSSLLTLGFSPPKSLLIANLVFTEGVLGLLLVALLISYLPTIYSAFQRREAAVTMLAVRAGEPPSALEMLQRYHRIHGLERLAELWPSWEMWFADIDESHTSQPALVFFRSPASNHSWVTASGAVLDAASLMLSAIDIPKDPQAMLCIRAGFISLRDIAGFFDLPFPEDPHYPENPISITREEFELVCRELAEQGVPLVKDLDAAWNDFAGWRVNYDQALLGLCTLTLPPPAPWSSDRAEQTVLPPKIPKYKRRMDKPPATLSGPPNAGYNERILKGWRRHGSGKGQP